MQKFCLKLMVLKVSSQSRMQFFRCALLRETLKLSCWRECSMKDDPSHFSHDIEPVQLQKRLISKFTGNFITCFVSIYPAKSASFQPTFQFQMMHSSVISLEQTGAKTSNIQNQSLSPGGGPCHGSGSFYFL